MVICPRFRDFWQAGEEIYPGTVFAQGGKKDMSKTQTYNILIVEHIVYMCFLYSLYQFIISSKEQI